MGIRLRRPWRARLIVAGTALVLAVGGVTMLLWSEMPPPYVPPPQLPGAHGIRVVQAYESTLDLDLDTPPEPATVGGAVLLAVSGGLCVGGCFIRRKEQARRP
ncbi:hypothetical protein [Streptomyces sp. NPDC048637]|uniref:hypothetical protein n=1 Tax=Streptomyces sp. NPDC048637 TaxID=3155636 RepID=UPI00341F2149